MTRALTLARNGQYTTPPNPMVGAVLVSPDGIVVGEGWHHTFGQPHAEVECIRDYERKSPQVTNLTLYVTLEPCCHYGKTPPCTELILSKGIKRVVVGCLDPNPLVAGKGVVRLREEGVEVITGVLEKECRELNKRFICFYEKHRPYITLKWAQTVDGFLDRIRTKGEPITISTPITKCFVHKLRAINMGIMVGTNTVLLDNPMLTVKHWCGKTPIRITIDSHGRIPKDSHLFDTQAQTIVYSTREWGSIVTDLYDRGVQSVLVEGGAKLLNSILDSGIYDELDVEVAPEKRLSEGVVAPQIPLNGMITYLDKHYFNVSLRSRHI